MTRFNEKMIQLEPVEEELPMRCACWDYACPKFHQHDTNATTYWKNEARLLAAKGGHSGDRTMLQSMYDYFQGPEACSDFTCICGTCGLCEFREEVKAYLASSPAAREESDNRELSARQKEMGLIELNLRQRIHNIERHNQYFFRCESAWCNPSDEPFGNPALDPIGDRFSLEAAREEIPERDELIEVLWKAGHAADFKKSPMLNSDQNDYQRSQNAHAWKTVIAGPLADAVLEFLKPLAPEGEK